MKAWAHVFLIACLITGLVWGLLPGCKQAPEPGNPQALRPSESVLGIDEVPQAFASATCAQRQRCCASHVRAARYGDKGGGNVASCEAAVLPGYSSYAQQIGNSHLHGRIAYDGDKLKKCLTQIAEQSCSDARTLSALGPQPGSDCDTWIVPRVGLGGTCGNDYECMSQYCQGRTALPKRGISDGICAPMPALGQPCTDECTRGAYCDASTDNPHCAVAMPHGAQCREDAECLTGVCDTAAGATFGTCGTVSGGCSAGL